MVTEIEKKILEAYRQSMEYLESTSALELMGNAGLFMNDLKKLVDSQRLPADIIMGCLMNEVHRLNSEPDNALLDDKLAKLFRSFKRYIDENFMKKE